MPISQFYSSNKLPFPDLKIPDLPIHELIPTLQTLDEIWCAHLDVAEFIGDGMRTLRSKHAKKIIDFLTSNLAERVWNNNASEEHRDHFFTTLDSLVN